MGISKVALLVVLLSCVERCLSASCVVDSFTVKQDFDPKRVREPLSLFSFSVSNTQKILALWRKLQNWLWLFSLLLVFHCSMQESGMPCRRRTQRACSCRTTSQLSTPLMMTAPWPPPPRDVSLSLGKCEDQLMIFFFHLKLHANIFPISAVLKEEVFFANKLQSMHLKKQYHQP